MLQELFLAFGIWQNIQQTKIPGLGTRTFKNLGMAADVGMAAEGDQSFSTPKCDSRGIDFKLVIKKRKT